jgi:hypothetical protein
LSVLWQDDFDRATGLQLAVGGFQHHAEIFALKRQRFGLLGEVYFLPLEIAGDVERRQPALRTFAGVFPTQVMGCVLRNTRSFSAMNGELVEELLRMIRGQFYGDAPEKLFFQERKMLIRAITWPARWFSERAMPYPEGEYKALILRIVMEIKRHGDLARVRSFGRYLLTAIQEHMKHQGERYYNEAKTLQKALDSTTARLKLSDEKRAATQFIEHLAAANKIVGAGIGKRRKKQPAQAIQDDFFGHAGGLL